jgi:FKBP-type peptidyl-prolyl cis-trans isomerase
MFAEITTGNGSVAGAGKKVHVNYRGWLTNGTIFDENLDAGKPFAFTLGAGNVIPGWEQTVAGMKVGGERLLIIPPSVGYGTKGQGPVPANAIMIFYVKLLSVD